MDNNFNRVRLCGRAAGEPALSHINHGEHFYRFPLSVERLSGQEDLLPVILRPNSGGEPPVRAGGLSALHRLGGHRPADGPASGGFPPDGGGPGPEPGLYENRGRRGPGAHRL